MENFYKKWNGKVIEDWGGYCSDEFKSFTRAFKNTLKKALDSDYELIGFKASHYDFSGFVKKADAYVYVSYSMNRGLPLALSTSGCCGGILVRTAKNDKDYIGGPNTFACFLSVKGQIEKLINLQLSKKEVA